MTLLQKLTNALNKVNGNVLTMEDDRGYDEYFCTVCKNRVYEHEYNHKHQCCHRCFWDEGDNTRADDGDAPEEV